jgi:hypothetical protein
MYKYKTFKVFYPEQLEELLNTFQGTYKDHEIVAITEHANRFTIIIKYKE